MSIRKGDTLIAGSKLDRKMSWTTKIDITADMIRSGYRFPEDGTIVLMVRNEHNPPPSGKDYNLFIDIICDNVSTEIARLYTKFSTGAYRPVNIQMTVNKDDQITVRKNDGNVNNLTVTFGYFIPWKAE